MEPVIQSNIVSTTVIDQSIANEGTTIDNYPIQVNTITSTTSSDVEAIMESLIGFD